MFVGNQEIPAHLFDMFEVEQHKSGDAWEEVDEMQWDYALVTVPTTAHMLSSIAWRVEAGVMVLNPTLGDVLDLEEFFEQVRVRDYKSGSWAIARYSKCRDRVDIYV